jgi:hypothetical protein
MADILKKPSPKPSRHRGGMSFEEIFGPGKQAGPTPGSPEARKWRRAFADNVTAVLRVREISRTEAEIVGFENTVIEFFNATHPDTDPNRCAHCGRPETPNSVLRPIGAGARHVWLHSDCVTLWREQYRAEAIAALAEAGVHAPVPVTSSIPCLIQK